MVMSKGAIAALLLQHGAFMTVLMGVLVRVAMIMAVGVAMIVAWMSVTKCCETHDVHNQSQNADDEELI